MLRNSLIREMSFKANFLLWMLVEVLWFVGQIVFFSIIFANVDRIGDWTKWEVVLLIGTHQMISQLFQAFFFVNVANIPELVRTGKLDSLLVLPIDSQFAVSTKQFGLDSIVNAIVGGVVVGVSLSKLGIVPTPISILLYLIAICLALWCTIRSCSGWPRSVSGSSARKGWSTATLTSSTSRAIRIQSSRGSSNSSSVGSCPWSWFLTCPRDCWPNRSNDLPGSCSSSWSPPPSSFASPARFGDSPSGDIPAPARNFRENR